MSEKLHYIVIILCCISICLGSCSKDDDDYRNPNLDPEPFVVEGAALEIMVVFAPKQLDNMGYASRLLRGAYEMKDSLCARDSLDVSFISSPTMETTSEEMVEWASDSTNSVYSNIYRRRLLVLAEPFLVPMLRDIKQYLRPVDEVLVLKTTDEYLREAEDTLHLNLGNRLHAISISAAETTRSWMCYRQFILSLASVNDRYAPGVTIYHLFPDEVYHYCDSIKETLIEEGMPEDSINVYTFMTSPERFYSTLQYIGSDMIEFSYILGKVIVAQYYYDHLKRFGIVDFGMGNAAFNYFLLNSEYQQIIVPAIVNADAAFGINCLYDKALKLWATRWLKQPPGAMPAMEWHGIWDGCCPDVYSTFRN
jgi:hypothetical protein